MLVERLNSFFPKSKLKELVEKAIDINIPISQYYYFLFKKLKKKYPYRASKVMEKAILISPKAIYFYELALIYSETSQWWQMKDAAEKAINIKRNANIEWYILYVQSLRKMGKYEDTINILNEFRKKNKLNAYGYFLYGDALKKIGYDNISEKYFRKTIIVDKKYNSKIVGIGIFYENERLWNTAIECYENENKTGNNKLALYIRWGLVNEQCYNWRNAKEIYIKAITIYQKEASLYFSLGFVEEKMKNFNEAVRAYRLAIEYIGLNIPYWYYRLGYVLEKQKKYKESCTEFIKKEENNISLVKCNHILRENILKENKHNKNLYFALAKSLMLQGKYQDASICFTEQYIIKSPQNSAIQQINTPIDKSTIYAEYYNRLKIDENIILYESFAANKMSCNTLALFEKIYKDLEFSNKIHVWAIKDLSIIDDYYKNKDNIIFIQRDSDAYLRYLCMAKYLINNSGFPSYFIRKVGQQYLATWHGTPLKTLGKEQKYKFMDYKRTQRDFFQATHIISPNKHTSDIFLNSYDLSTIYSGKIAETGYPRVDKTLNKSITEKQEIRNSLGLDSSKKVLLYAPTWRGTLENINIDIKRLKNDMEKMSNMECQVLFRGHYLLESKIKTFKNNFITVPNTIDTNDLLSIVDILITDYSSIFFDFLSLQKPIIYYMYDLKEYENERGLYFNINDLPGDKCKSINEVLLSIQTSINKGIGDDKTKYLKFEEVYAPLDDGKATKRVIDFFFYGNDTKVIYDETKIKNKNNILIFPGALKPNGISTSLINLVNKVDKNKATIIIPINPDHIETSKDSMSIFKKIDSTLTFIPRYGNMIMTVEERKVNEQAKNSNYSNLSIDEWKILERIYQREFRRIFGESYFKVGIHFSGYNEFWANLIGFTDQVGKKCIYQHNDLFDEWKTRFPELEIIFNLYKYFDKIISVSKLTMNNNFNKLSNSFNLDKSKIDYCHNLQNYKEILLNSKKSLEDNKDNKIYHKNNVFINIARLSPEKDQEKLIYAFKKILNIYPDVKLIILGKGFLWGKLTFLIKNLELEEKVFLLGQKSNPYAYLEKSSCFILSSNHEGQPMTLFEALILHKPIIATNIVGNRSVLNAGLGCIVENSQKGLVQGMLDFLDGKNHCLEDFNYKKYNNDALQMFYDKVIINL